MTPEDVEIFRKDGVIVLRDFFPKDTVGKITAELECYVETMAPSLTGAFVNKQAGEAGVRGLSWINMFSPYFAAMLEQSVMSETIEELTGWTPRSFFCRCILETCP